MEREQWQQVAFGASVMALVVAIASGRLPRRVRVALIAGLAVLLCGAGLYTYHYLTRPMTLTVAAGSADGDAARIMTAIAARMTAAGAPVRLKIIDEGNALAAIKAFDAGTTDLAVARADITDPSVARSVVVITRAAVLLVAPPGSSIRERERP